MAAVFLVNLNTIYQAHLDVLRACIIGINATLAGKPQSHSSGASEPCLPIKFLKPNNWNDGTMLAAGADGWGIKAIKYGVQR